jgi:rfaE bifunctional protein kinase chain/domain
MEKAQLQKILEDIRNVRIIVVGDFCLDTYWFVDETMSEISVETGHPTRPVSKQRYSLGGAGNVANNLAAIGVKEILAFGVIGCDPFGTEMTRIMKNTGINTDNLLIQEHDWDTHTYAKPYIEESELNRIDFGNFNHLSESTANNLVEKLKEAIIKAEIIIINQQVPSGIHTDYFRKRLTEVIDQFPGKKFITDSRSYNDSYNGTIRKMNDKEAFRLCGRNSTSDEQISLSDLTPVAKELFKRYQKPLFITRGARGSVTVDETGIKEIPGLMILSKVDTVGAGDSYLAGAAAALASGYCLEEAAQLGTFVAGVTVQKLYQTGTADPDEILAIGTDPDFIYSPELAEDIRHAAYIENTEIEIINRWNIKPEVKHAIFDHDGTISTLREGWELIMAPVMIRAILGDRYDEADESLFRKVSIRVKDYIDKTTGIQTLAQMYGLIDLIREFGCVPKDKILDPSGYKNLYNNELMNLVREREKKLANGELSIDDLTLKNAVPFLRLLFDSGIKLWLVSGTDVEDVTNESRTLGYEHLFEGRIYGAVGDIKKEAKKEVLDQMLDKMNASSSAEIITFGDGPVEMRETRKRGGLTVGIASNELRRYGLNEQKRTRLIKAGADIVIPDFSQYQGILKLLNI